jgi:TonB-dependent receptor
MFSHHLLPGVRRHSVRSSIVAALLAGSTLALAMPALAQDRVADPALPDDPGEQTTGEQTTSEVLTGDIVVNGRRDRSALAEERTMPGVVDIVTTGDVAINSQTNVTDLARRLPGVSVARDQGRNQSATGETQFATIRGLDTGFNAYTLDGVRLPQTSGNGRAISLNLFSPFAIGALVVDKTPGATRDADAIAGIIDLRTPTAFDFSTNFTRARVLAQAAGLALDREQEAWGGAIGIDAARRFGADRQFGIYIAGYYEERANAANSTAVQNDYKTTNFGVGTPRANPQALSPDGVQWNFYNNRIKRYGASGSLDLRTDPLDLYARVNYATYLNTNTMNQTGLRNELTSGQTSPNPNRSGNRSYDAAGVYTPIGVNPASYFRTEDIEQELFSAQVGAKAHWNGFTAALEGAYADGRFDQPSRIEAAFRGISYANAAQAGTATEAWSVDLSNPVSPRPVISSGAAAYVASLDRPTQLYVQQGYDYLSEKKKTLRASIGHDGDGLLRRVEIGGLYEDSDRSGRSLAPDNTRYRFRTPLQAGTMTGPSINEYLGYVLKDFLDYYPVRPIKVLSRAQLDSQARILVPTIVVPQTVINQGLLTGDERRKAVYASATLAAGTFELVPGIRYEDNDYRARFFQGQGADARFVNTGRSYDHVDPSLLAAWRPDERLVVRGAVRSSYARPAFGQLAGPTVISRDAASNAILTITEPNPDLKPVEAWSYDLGVEYYGGTGRYAQLAVYHKDLSNILVPTGTRSVGETIDGIVRIRPANGRSGKVSGVEASGRFTLGDMVASPLLSGVGIGGNVTWQRTEATYQIAADDIRTSRLPQAPKLIYNAELFYAAGPMRANLWYNYTGRVLTTVQDSQPDIYVQPLKELNFGLAIAVTDHLEIGASARNLLDQAAYWTTVGPSKKYIAPDRNGGFMKTGRVFQISLTMTR